MKKQSPNLLGIFTFHHNSPVAEALQQRDVFAVVGNMGSKHDRDFLQFF